MIEFFPALCLAGLLVLQPPFKGNPSEKHEGPSPGQALRTTSTPIPGLRASLRLPSDGAIRVTGHVGFQLEQRRGRGADEAQVMISLRLAIDGRYVSGATIVENVPRSQHYQDVPLSFTLPLDAGLHVVQLRANQKVLNDEGVVAFFKSKEYSRVQLEILQPC